MQEQKMLFKPPPSPNKSQQQTSKIKANFLDQELRQMQQYIDDLQMSCQTNKSIIKSLIQDRQGNNSPLTYTIEQLSNQNTILAERLRQTLKQRDDSQARLLIQQQINANSHVKQIQLETDYKEKLDEIKEQIERKQYQIQNQEHRYTELEVFLKNLSQNDQAIGEKLRTMKIQLSRQGRITNVVEQNQHLRAELDLARIESSRFKIKLQNIERDKNVLEKKIKEVQSHSFNLGTRSPAQNLIPQTTLRMETVKIPLIGGSNNNLSTLGSPLPPKIPILNLGKIKKIEPKKPTYQYIKKLQDSIKIITQKNNQLQDENFDLQQENKILQDTNNNLYEYGEKAKSQLRKADQKIKLLQDKIQKLKMARNNIDHNVSRSARTGGMFETAHYLKGSTRDSVSNQFSGSKKQSFGFHDIGNNEEEIKHKIGGNKVSPIHQRKQILPPHGKGINPKIINSVYKSGNGSGGCSPQYDGQLIKTKANQFFELQIQNNNGQPVQVLQQQHLSQPQEEFFQDVKSYQEAEQEHELSKLSLPDSFADKELIFIKGYGVDDENSEESERI